MFLTIDNLKDIDSCELLDRVLHAMDGNVNIHSTMSVGPNRIEINNDEALCVGIFDEILLNFQDWRCTLCEAASMLFYHRIDKSRQLFVSNESDHLNRCKLPYEKIWHNE